MSLPIERAQLIQLDEIPDRAKPWVQYDESITLAVESVTGSVAKVKNLCQFKGPCPDWIPSHHQREQLSFIRHIELFSREQRVLSAWSYTDPDGDLVEKLLALGNQPLANLLFASGSSRSPTLHWIHAEGHGGRAIEWQVTGCASSLMLVELFDATFVSRYAPSEGLDR